MKEITSTVNTEKLSEIGSILQMGLNQGETYNAVFELVQSVIPFESATLFLCNEETNQLEIAKKQGKCVVDLASDVLFSRGKGVSSFVSNQKKPIILQSLANSRAGKLDKFKSFLSLPLWIGDKLIGVMNLGHDEADVYNYDCLNDYEKLSQQISLVVDKMKLKTQLEKQNDLLRETLDQLKDAQDKLVQKERLAAIGEFVVTVNHEINNPLSTIFTNAEMLPHVIKSKNDESLLRISDRIMNAANKISNVTKKLANLTTKFFGINC